MRCVGARRARQRATALPSCQTAKPTLGPHQRVAAHRLEAVRELGRLGLQELAPRRRAEEQLAHLDAWCRRARAAGAQLAGARVEPGRVRGVGGAAGDRDLGDRGDRRQRLAAKAHRRHALELGERGDLAGRVAAQRQRQLVGGDAVAVVLDRRWRGCRRRSGARRSAVAPASSALSSSSRTTEAGRSTTSPAAIWLISSSGSSRIGRRRRGSSTAFIAAL